MTATIISMDYAYVDNLSADQLLEGDLIEINDEVVQILELNSAKDAIVISYENEFGEKEIQEFSDETIFKLFVMRPIYGI
jgi:hypothetical protein